MNAAPLEVFAIDTWRLHREILDVVTILVDGGTQHTDAAAILRQTATA